MSKVAQQANLDRPATRSSPRRTSPVLETLPSGRTPVFMVYGVRDLVYGLRVAHGGLRLRRNVSPISSPIDFTRDFTAAERTLLETIDFRLWAFRFSGI